MILAVIMGRQWNRMSAGCNKDQLMDPFQPVITEFNHELYIHRYYFQGDSNTTISLTPHADEVPVDRSSTHWIIRFETRLTSTVSLGKRQSSFRAVDMETLSVNTLFEYTVWKHQLLNVFPLKHKTASSATRLIKPTLYTIVFGRKWHWRVLCDFS